MGALDTALTWLGVRRGPPPVEMIEAQAFPLVKRRGRPRSGTYLVEPLPIYAQLQRIGGSLTPLDVSAIMREADTGRMARLMDLANEARQKDCHLQSILATNEESIAGLPWALELPDDAKLKERKAADWIEQQLRSCRSFSRFVAHHAGAVYYGHAVSEILWAKVDGGRLAPVEFCPIAPRRFLYEAEEGRLCWCDENAGMPYPGVDIRAAHPEKFVVSQPRVNGDVPCREGLVRVLMWAALFRNWALSDWLKLGEIAWKPWRTASYGKDQSGDDEIDEIIAKLEQMSSTGVAVLPETVKVSVEWPKGAPVGGGMHKDLFTLIGSEMSKATLGQTLTTEQGERGARSLGEVHDEVRKDLRENRSGSVAEDVTRDVVERMYRLNFADGIRAAKFVFLTDDAHDLAQFSAAMKALTEAGLRIPSVWVRDELGIPEPDEDEECIGGPQEDPQAPPQDAGPAGPGAPGVTPTDAQDAVDDAA